MDEQNQHSGFVLSRRALLRRAASLGGLALLAACGGAGNATSDQTSPTQPAAAPADATAASSAPTAMAGATEQATTAAAPADATTAATTEATTAPAMAATTAPATTSAPAAQISAPIKLRVWGFGLDDARAKARLATFTKAQPNVTIEPVGGDLNTQQLLTSVASGDPPEVISFDRAQTGSWAGRSAIDPIDDLISRDGFDLSQFYPFTIDQVKYNGQTYGVPQFVNLDLIYLNLDVLKEAGVDLASVDPGNWDQLQKIGAQLHKMEGDKVVRTGFDTKIQDGRLWLWSWANGVDLISADGQKANFNDPKVVEALTWGKDTVDKQGGEKARAAFAQAQNFFSPQNPVLIGQTAMTVFEQWLIGVMKVNPQANFRTILPRMRNSTTPVTQAGGSAFAIPKGVSGANREAAWTFIKGLTSTDAWLAGEQATLADDTANKQPYHPAITGNIKADQESWNTIYTGISAGYDETVKLFPDALKAARFPYSGPVAAQIKDLTTAAVNDALQGVRSPKDALDDLQQKAQQALDDFKNGVR